MSSQDSQQPNPRPLEQPAAQIVPPPSPTPLAHDPMPLALPVAQPLPSKTGVSLPKKVLLAVAVLFVLGVVTGLGFVARHQLHKPARTNDGVVQDLRQKSTLTAADVQAINKDDAFYAYVKKAAQEKRAVITKAFYLSKDGTPQNENLFSKVGVDYQTKKIVYAYEEAIGARRDRTRCYDQIEEDYNALIGMWRRNARATTCTQGKLYREATDGFNAGGLTADQAEVFVAYLHSHAGLFTVKNLQLEDHKGQQYLHFTVTLNQIGAHGTYYAAEWLKFAFNNAGLDSDSYPYGYVGAGTEGFTLEYYVDPHTGLPAYSELTALASPGDTSGNKTGDYHYQVQYDFTNSTFDASPNNNEYIAITW